MPVEVRVHRVCLNSDQQRLQHTDGHPRTYLPPQQTAAPQDRDDDGHTDNSKRATGQE